jgi:hypothetical protein
MARQQSQQDFLRDAMEQLGMTRQQFAGRIGGSKRALDNWLLPGDSNGFRSMPDPIWTLVREILPKKTKKA